VEPLAIGRYPEPARALAHRDPLDDGVGGRAENDDGSAVLVGHVDPFLGRSGRTGALAFATARDENDSSDEQKGTHGQALVRRTAFRQPRVCHGARPGRRAHATRRASAPPLRSIHDSQPITLRATPRTAIENRRSTGNQRLPACSSWHSVVPLIVNTFFHCEK